MSFHLTATERHLPYEITQCYLLPDTSDILNISTTIFSHPKEGEGQGPLNTPQLISRLNNADSVSVPATSGVQPAAQMR